MVFHTEQKSNIEKLCKHLKSEGFPIVSVFLDKQQTPGNEIFAYDFQKLMGKEVLADSIGDIRFHIKPGSFFQANPKGAAKIYRRIQALAGEGQGGFALDLYCGTGPIAFHMAELGYSVIGVEEIEQAVASAQVNKELNIFPEEVGFVCEDVASFLQHEMKQACVGKDLKWVTVNPSRKGLGAEVCKLLLECLPESTQLLYMSCEMESLSADLKVLKDGGMAVKQIEAFDLFPGTKHLEWLTVLSRLKH